MRVLPVPIEGGRASVARRVATGRHGTLAENNLSPVLPEGEGLTWLGWSGDGGGAISSDTGEDDHTEWRAPQLPRRLVADLRSITNLATHEPPRIMSDEKPIPSKWAAIGV